MTEDTTIASQFLSDYRQQIIDGIARNLRNIYLANVKAFCTKGKVCNAAMMQLEPDERFMRLVEGHVCIDESQVQGWRGCIWGAWCDNNNTALLDIRLGPVFNQMATDYQAVNKALMVYTNILDLSTPK